MSKDVNNTADHVSNEIDLSEYDLCDDVLSTNNLNDVTNIVNTVTCTTVDDSATIEEAGNSFPEIVVPSSNQYSPSSIPAIVLSQWPDSIKAEEGFLKLIYSLFPSKFSSCDLCHLRREIALSSDLFDDIIVFREMTPPVDDMSRPVVSIHISIPQLKSKVQEECAIAMSSKKYSKVIEMMYSALVLLPKYTTFMYQIAAALAQLVCLRQEELPGATEEVSGIDVTYGSVIHFLQQAFDNGEKDIIDKVYDDSDFYVLRDTEMLKAFTAGVEGEKVATLKTTFPSSSVTVIKSALANSGDDASVAALTL